MCSSCVFSSTVWYSFHPLNSPHISALINLAVVHCMVFRVFVFAKAVIRNKVTVLPNQKESNKGIVQKDIDKTTRTKVEGKKEIESDTSVACRLVIFRVDVCTPRVVKNSLDADTPLDVAVQHLADEVNAVFAHDIRYAQVVIHNLVDAVEWIFLIHDCV